MNKFNRQANITIVKDALRQGNALEEWRVSSVKAATQQIIEEHEQLIHDLQVLREEIRGKLNYGTLMPVNDFYDKYDLGD